MSMVADCPPRITRAFDLGRYDAFGADSEKLREEAMRVARHWEARPGFGIHDQPEIEADESSEFPYGFVQGRKVGTVMVQYKYGGRGKPLPYGFDE